ncbi:YncE family protein [Candidatus Omnitrophota bacterium]
MKKYPATIIFLMVFVFAGLAFPETSREGDEFFEKSKDYKAMIPIKVMRKIKLPPGGYHEGILVEKNRILVNNGDKKNTWAIDRKTGDLLSEIIPVATFSEGITRTPDGGYWLTDWDTCKLYRIKFEKNKMVPEFEVSFQPSHPTGVVWGGNHLYVITWTRGIGTRYDLLKLDTEGNVLQEARMKDIQEPSQIAWDGKDLWISSWFQRRAYKIDTDTLEIKGYFRTKIDKTTGIAWDGKYFWLTGTKADLYQVEVLSPEE